MLSRVRPVAFSFPRAFRHVSRISFLRLHVQSPTAIISCLVGCTNPLQLREISQEHVEQGLRLPSGGTIRRVVARGLPRQTSISAIRKLSHPGHLPAAPERLAK